MKTPGVMSRVGWLLDCSTLAPAVDISLSSHSQKEPITRLLEINFIYEELQPMFSENTVDVGRFHGRGTTEPSLRSLSLFVFMFSFRLGSTNTENSVLIMS